MRVIRRLRVAAGTLGLLAAAHGCDGSSNNDFDRFGSGQHLKTPSEVRAEAEAKYGKPGKKTEAKVAPKVAAKAEKKAEAKAPAEPAKDAPEKK